MKSEIESLTENFLRWPLPNSVCADLCATKQGPGRIGTNLLSFIEAKQMFTELVAPLVAERDEAIAARIAAEKTTVGSHELMKRALAERDERTDDAEVAMKFQKKAEAENAALRAQLKDASMRGMSVALEAYTRDLADIKAENAALKSQVEKLEEAEKCSEIVVAQECEIIDEKDATITDLRAQLEQAKEERKTLHKIITGDTDEIVSLMQQLATATAELAQERARLEQGELCVAWDSPDRDTTVLISRANETGRTVIYEGRGKDGWWRESHDAARKQEGKTP